MVKRIGINDSKLSFDKNVSCIGFFEALHKGHLELINRTIEMAKKMNVRSMLICFEPDPLELISGHKQHHILDYNERIERIKSLGINDIVVFRFDEQFMKIDPVVFVEDYLNKMNISRLICGFDFRFGYHGKGNHKILEKYASFALEVVDEVKLYGQKISSTRIKLQLSKGNLKLVEKLLGYKYYLLLKVVKCSKNGSNNLIEAILIDKYKIIPAKINEIYENVTYKDGIFYINDNIDVNKDDKLILEFE